MDSGWGRRVRKLLLLLLLALLVRPAAAQVGAWSQSAAWTSAPTTSYIGPGDVQSNWTWWYGVQAFSAAQALAGALSVNIQRVTDSHTCDVKVSSSGGLGLTANCSIGGDNGQTPIVFAGTDAICNGSISGTTLSIASCSSGTLHLNDQITGTGITNPQWITAIGTCASPPGTCTVNNSMSVGSTTITAAAGLAALKFYDQSGANSCEVSATPPAVPCNTAINNGTHTWVLLANCIGSNYCLGNPPGNTIGFATTSYTAGLALTSTMSEPLTVSFVAERTVFTSPSWGGIVQSTTGASDPWLGFNNNANNAVIFAAIQATAPANDAQLHAIQELMNSGANLTIFNVDGTETTTNAGSGSLSGGLDIGVLPASGSGNSGLPGYLGEVGGLALGLTSAQRKTVCENEQSRWVKTNFPANC